MSPKNSLADFPRTGGIDQFGDYDAGLGHRLTERTLSKYGLLHAAHQEYSK